MELDTGGTLSHCISNQSFSFERFTEACKDSITDPAKVIKIVEDEELSEKPLVQLKPQRVKLEMRAGEYVSVMSALKVMI